MMTMTEELQGIKANPRPASGSLTEGQNMMIVYRFGYGNCGPRMRAIKVRTKENVCLFIAR
jgi:hypothetical protein